MYICFVFLVFVGSPAILVLNSTPGTYTHNYGDESLEHSLIFSSEKSHEDVWSAAVEQSLADEEHIECEC